MFGLPNGATVALGTTIGSSIAYTAISNANPAVVTSTAHGQANGDMLIVQSGWPRINNRIFRVAGVTANTFNLEGMDTTDTLAFPVGAGIGSVQKITAFTQITQVQNLTASGGEMQFTDVSFLENNFKTQIPTQSSAQTMTIEIADDAASAGQIALKAADLKRAMVPLRLALPTGASLYYYGFMSFNETPVVTKDQLMVVKATFSLAAPPVRY